MQSCKSRTTAYEIPYYGLIAAEKTTSKSFCLTLVISSIFLILLLISPNNLCAAACASLPDPALEERAIRIIRELRCPTCAGEGAAESATELAVAMRCDVRAKIASGIDDDVVRESLRIRYGNAIFLNPPMRQETLWLWLVPISMILITVTAGLYWLYRRRMRLHTTSI